MREFDVVIIGAGPGGYVAAIRAAQLGLKTALVEREERLGGTCLNVGCIPSKALLESSEIYASARNRWREHGIISSDVRVDLKEMMKRKQQIVSQLTDGIGLLMKKNRVEVIKGIGTMVSRNEVSVSSGDKQEVVKSPAVLLAMGSVPVELPFMKFDGKRIISSTEALALSKTPRSMAVIGGGAVGLEMGSVWSRLGAKVTVLEMLPNIAAFADKQISTMLQKSLNVQGMDIELNARVTGAKPVRGGLSVVYTDKSSAERELNCDTVLVAVGRKPNSASVGLEGVGVRVERDGRIPVDETYQTNVPGIYAIGDLIAGPMLAHKASDEGIAVAEILAGKPGHVNYDAIPNVIYTAPELAAVGMTEEQAKAKGVQYKVGKYFFRGNGRALSLGESEGFVKLIADAATDRLLGAHILGARASELIAEMALAIEFRASSEDIARTCHAHPTLSEAVREAAMAVSKMQIHG